VIVVASEHVSVQGSWRNCVGIVIPAMAGSASKIAPKRPGASKASCLMAGRPPRAFGGLQTGRGPGHSTRPRRPGIAPATLSSQGRFGDSGLITVVPAKVKVDALTIDTCPMSCRIAVRSVEQFLLKHLARLALARALMRLLGEFSPAPRNDSVRDHFHSLRPPRIGAHDSGHTCALSQFIR
jgi:hypothetical protein